MSSSRLPTAGAVGADGYLDELYLRARSALYRTAALLLPPDEAEDVVQEAFERAFKIKGFEAQTAEPVAWLRKVVGRIAVDRLRRRKLWERIRTILILEPQTEPSTDLRDALRRLPPRQRVALVLRYYQDASHAEIAEALSIGTDSVGPLLARAKRALREALM